MTTELLKQALSAMRDVADLMADRWPMDTQQRAPKFFQAMRDIDTALAQPADDDAWQREMFGLINELHSAGLDGSRGRCRDAVLALNENIRDRPAREGFVSVPVEPPIEEVEAIIACLEDDAAMLRDEKSDCEIAANMVQAVALIRLLLAIPAADVDLIAAAKGGGK